MSYNFYIFIVLLFSSLSISYGQLTEENCSNQIDDDLDGLVDLNDPDCICNIGFAELSENYIRNGSFELQDEDLDGCNAPMGCPNFHSGYNCMPYWDKGNVQSTPDAWGLECEVIESFEFYVNTLMNNLPPNDGLFYAGIISQVSDTDYMELISSCLIEPVDTSSYYQFKIQIGYANMPRYSYFDIKEYVYSPDTALLGLYGNLDCSDTASFEYQYPSCPFENGSAEWELIDTIKVIGQAWEWVEYCRTLKFEKDYEQLGITGICETYVAFPGQDSLEKPAWNYYFLDDIGLYKYEQEVDPELSIAVSCSGATLYSAHLIQTLFMSGTLTARLL